MTDKIKTRESYLVVQDLGNEILIYDLKTNKAFCLSETAAIVWRLCDGEKTVAEISKIMSNLLKTPVSEDYVWLAIDDLKRENLLANPEHIHSKSEGHSRRDIIMKVGLTTMIALPWISSVVAPTAANAQSNNCLPSGQTFCLSLQTDIRTCINTINNAATNQCCDSSLSDILFDPTDCCGTCGTAAP